MTTADVPPATVTFSGAGSAYTVNVAWDALTNVYSLPLHLDAVSLGLAYVVQAKKSAGSSSSRWPRTGRSGTDPAPLLGMAGVAVAKVHVVRDPPTEPRDNRRDGGSWPPGQMTALRWCPAERCRNGGPQSARQRAAAVSLTGARRGVVLPWPDDRLGKVANHDDTGSA